MAIQSHITDILKLLQIFLRHFKEVFLLLFMPFEMHRIRYFFRKKILRKRVPTLPKIF